MSSRKDIWAGMDRLENKKEGSSYQHLEKEIKRQSGKKEMAKKMKHHIDETTLLNRKVPKGSKKLNKYLKDTYASYNK